MKKAAIISLALLGGAYPFDLALSKDIAHGVIDVRQPGTKRIEKIHITCGPMFNTDTKEFNVTGISIPVTSVIKPEIGGISTKTTAQNAFEKIMAMDLQQAEICVALLITSDEQARLQILKDYIGIGGQLTSLIRSLSDATTAQQYEATARNAQPPKVAPTTASAASNAKKSNPDLAKLNIPPVSVILNQTQ